MKDSAWFQKFYSFLVSTHQWYLNTPQRSLEQAYQAALKIKALEEQHFNGNKITPASTSYGSTLMDFFEADLKKELREVRMRLTEFRISRSFLNTLPQNPAAQAAAETLNSTAVLEKLRFIDEVVAKYKEYEYEEPQNSSALVVGNPQLIDIESKVIQTQLQNSQNNGSSQPPRRSKADTTGVLPRSIWNTINRLQVELDPNSEQDVVTTFRRSQRRTSSSIKFILLLIIVPLLTHQLSKALVVGPIVDHFRKPETAGIFLNFEMEEEALSQLQRFEESLKFRNFLSEAKLSGEEIETRVEERAKELASEYRDESANAVKNVFADLLSVGAFVWLLLVSKREIAILKEFFDNVIYGLSDSAKAFIIILFTDVFVGFHSPHGWEVILESISKHWGLPANHSFIFLFIATFPVILDTIFKYWIFRYLNRISPSAVATYRTMNE